MCEVLDTCNENGKHMCKAHIVYMLKHNFVDDIFLLQKKNVEIPRCVFLFIIILFEFILACQINEYYKMLALICLNRKTGE